VFSKILCPIDFSDTSERALQYAAALAGSRRVPLELLHVIPAEEAWPPFDAARLSGAPTRAPEPVSSEAILAHMRDVVARAGVAGPAPALLHEHGRVHDVIVRAAAAAPDTLLVMGTHGRSGFNRLFLGSVTEKVTRTAPCPVLTVPPLAPGTPSGPVSLACLLCPIDYSASARKALDVALSLARPVGGRVIVLHALEYLDPHDPPSYVDPEIRHRHQQFIDDARQRLQDELARHDTTGVRVETVVALNRAHREIVQRAAASAADLIVMGAQGGGAVELMVYGSTTQHVVRAAPCPVLTVRA
jgi:nucleotide-binding universal stress UspA family protein